MHEGKLFVLQLQPHQKLISGTTWDLPAKLALHTPKGAKVVMPKVLEEGTTMFNRYMSFHETTLEDIIKGADLDDDVEVEGANTLSLYGLHSDEDEQ